MECMILNGKVREGRVPRWLIADYRYATCTPYVEAIQTECTILNGKVREVTKADYRAAKW
jgi:hypothetical protein